jgi:hypothetical protein
VTWKASVTLHGSRDKVSFRRVESVGVRREERTRASGYLIYYERGPL